MRFYTIGAFGSTESQFFEKLVEHKIDTFWDIRQRRGVRGAQYAFVNSARLQNRLEEFGIRYDHVVDLMPTDEIREIQNKIDSQLGVKSRDRRQLGKDFIQAYEENVLRAFDFNSYQEKLIGINARRIVLFCVEENPMACHRSIVSNHLESYGFKVTHLN